MIKALVTAALTALLLVGVGPASQTPASAATDNVFAYGRSTDAVCIGDWDGDGTDTLGVRRY